MCRAHERQKAVRSVTPVTLKILGQDPLVRQFTWGHSASSPLFWLSLLGARWDPTGWLSSPWSLGAALKIRAACEYVRAGGIEDAVAEKGVF